MATSPIVMVARDATTPDVARLLITLVAVGAFVAVLLPKQPEGHRPGRAAIAGTGLASGVLTGVPRAVRSEEHTSELQSLMRISYAVFCLKKKKKTINKKSNNTQYKKQKQLK